MVMRYDRLRVKAVKDEHGFIRDTPVLTRTGVFTYRSPDGTKRREYRPPDEVFNAESLKAFAGIPITDEHHGEIKGSNASRLVVGSVLSQGRQEGNNLIADIVIHDTAPVLQGKKELSVGYKVDIEETSGITEDGEAYDVIQRNIRPNHLAIVSKGRAGVAKLNLDAADAVEFNEEGEPKMGDNQKLSDIRLDSGITYQAAPEVVVEFNKLKQDVANALAEKDKEAARADTAEKKVQTLEQEKEAIKQDAYQQAKSRLQLESVAKLHKVEVKADSSDRQLREAIIKAVRGDSVSLEGKSEAYIEAIFDMAVADSQARADSEAQQRQGLTSTMKQDGEGKKSLSGREKMIAERNQ